MKGIITHEESQTVMKAFYKRGKDIYSNDLLACSGGLDERHLQMDCFKAIELIKPRFAGMHLECSFLTSARNKYYAPKYDLRFPTQHEDRKKAKSLLKKIRGIMWGEEKITITIEDPTGNSAIISEKAIVTKK